MKRVVFFLLLLHFLLPGVQAVEVRPIHVQTPDGLTGAHINCLTRSKDGYLWIGTPEGLLKYDGYDCRRYLPMTDVTALTEDVNGRLWIRTPSRWQIHESTTDSIISDTRPILDGMGIDSTPVHIGRDHKSGLWIATKDAIYHLPAGAKKASKVDFGSHPPLKGKRITDMVDGQRYITAVTEAGEIYDISPLSHIVERYNSHIPTLTRGRAAGPYSLHYDREGLLWIYNVESLWLFDSNRRLWMEDILPAEARNSSVRAILQDAWGRTWIGRDQRGLEQLKRAGSGFTFIPRSSISPTLRPGTVVTAICDDSSGNLWIGTDRNGLFYHDELTPRFISYALPSPHLILAESDDCVWLATENSGLLRWDPVTETTTTFTVPAHAPKPLSLAKAKGKIFTSLSEGGLWKAGEDHLAKIITGTRADSMLITALVTIPGDEGLVIGTATGELYTFTPSPDHGSYISLSRAFPEGRVNNLSCGKDSTIAIAKGRNAILLSSTMKKATILRGPWQSDLHCVMKDSRGLVWITSAEGIDLYRPGTGQLRRLLADKSSGGSIPGAIIETPDGSVWAATRNGLLRMTVTTDSVTDEPVVTTAIYDSAAGIPSGYLDPSALAALPKGDVLAGSAEGVSRFLPGRGRRPTRHPAILFSSITVGGKSVLPERTDSTQSIRISHSDQDLTISLSPDNPAVSARAGFRYMLEGYDRDWKTLPPGDHIITYTSIPWGNYKLLVKIFTGSIPTESDPTELIIKVSAPFYLSTPAIILYIFIIFFTGVGIRRWILRMRPAQTHVSPLRSPIAQPVPTTPGSTTSGKTEPEEAMSPAKKPERLPLLLIHSDREMLKRTSDLLAPHFEVFTATDGEAALIILRAILPSIIITGTPDETQGFNILCSTVKADPAVRHIPVLILGDDKDLSTRVDMFLCNAEAVVSPELPAPRMISIIRQLISLSESHSGTIIFPPLPTETSMGDEDTSSATDRLLLLQTVKSVVGNLSRADYSVEELATTLSISRVHLYKRLKALTGKTPVEIIRLIRLHEAAIILLGGDVTVTETATRVGFNSTKYFTRYFKEEFSLLPSEYRTPIDKLPS